MSQLQPQPAGIRDEDIPDQVPLVRALVVRRLEMVWRTCEPHISPDELTGRPDPRMIELGLRALDRLARVYRLDVPVAPVPEPPAALDAAGMVEAALLELESRVREG